MYEINGTMSYAETLRKVVQYLNDTTGQVSTLTDAMTYLQNIGIDESVSNSFNAMINDGTLATLVNDTLMTGKANQKDIKYVTYEMFGAKLDGVTDDTASIKACHDYANANNLKVIQNTGIIYITNTVTVQTSTDLTGCTLKINNATQNGKTLYQITSKNTPVTVTGLNQSQLVYGAKQIPSLASYKHNMITITSTEPIATRNDGGTATVNFKKDSFFLTRDGAMVSDKLLQDFTGGTLTVTAMPYENREIVFEGLKIDWDFKNLAYTCTAISLKRGNSKLRNVFLNIPNTIDYDDSAGGSFKGQAIMIQDAYNVTVENVVAENITEGKNASGYVLSLNNVINITMRNLVLLNGWGSIGTNNVKDWKVLDSIVNRIDVHDVTGDLFCKNVQFVGGWGVFVGYGDGRILLEDCVSDFIDIDGRQNNAVVYVAITYGLIYQGDIIIKNHRIISRSTQDRYLLRLPFSGTGIDYGVAYDIKLPNLYARDIKIDSIGTERVYGYGVTGMSSMITTLQNDNKKLVMPSNVQIENVDMPNNNDTSYFTAFRIDADSPTLNRMSPSMTKIRLKNIEQPIHSKYKTGFLGTADLTNYNAGLLKMLTYVSFPVDNSANVNFDVSIDNCGGTVYHSGNSNNFKITNSEIVTKVEFDKYTVVEETDPSVVYTGTWTTHTSSHSGGTMKYASTNGDSATCTFTGTGIRLISNTSNVRGLADIYIDGVFDTTIDMYRQGVSGLIYQDPVYEKKGLSNGTHTIKVVCKGQKSPLNTGGTSTIVSVDAFHVIQALDSTQKMNPSRFVVRNCDWYCYPRGGSFSMIESPNLEARDNTINLSQIGGYFMTPMESSALTKMLLNNMVGLGNSIVTTNQIIKYSRFTDVNSLKTSSPTDKSYVDTVLLDKANIVDLSYNNVTQPLSAISKKIVYKISDAEYRVISKKPSKSGFTYMKFTKDSGVVGDSQNIGTPWQLLRLSSVYDVTKALAYFKPVTYNTSQLQTSGVNDFQTYNTTTDYTSPSTVGLISNNTRNVANSYLEFTATIKKSNNGVLYLGFYGTSGSCKNIDILINGTTVRSAVDLSNVTAGIKIIPVSVANYIGDVTVRLQIPASPTNSVMHFLGYNAHDLAEVNENLDYNNALYTSGSNANHYISQSTGANEYAINSNGKWMGSFHGGETSNSLSVLLDGVDIASLTANSFVFGKRFEIVQSTNINNQITTNSITKVYNDSVFEFDCYFDVPTPFNVSLFYSLMTCSNDTFTHVVYPKSVDTLSGDTQLPIYNKVVQENPTNKYRITSMFTPWNYYKADMPLKIRFTSGSYCKVYHGQVVNSTDLLKSTGFSQVKIFD